MKILSSKNRVRHRFNDEQTLKRISDKNRRYFYLLPPNRVVQWNFTWDITSKGFFFFQKVGFFFKSAKKYSKKTILNLKFKIPAHNSSMFWAGILNFKFRIVFGIFYFGDSEIWKKELNFLKKATFRQFYYCFVFKIFNFLKLQLCTGQNVHVMLCIALMVIAQYRTYIELLCC